MGFLPDCLGAGGVSVMIEPMLFEHDPRQAVADLAEGVREFVVDWESRGKDARQRGYDTEIRPGSEADLRAMAALPGARIWCRINGWWWGSDREIERAIAAGASGLFLPMVTAADAVERFLRRVDGRCAAGILVETTEAVAIASTLVRLPLDRVYFGLNDFAISRGGGSIFRAVGDGTVERMAAVFAGSPFGFGGLTRLAAGHPVPCRYLLEEMVRLDCRFTFLRRSFRTDTRTGERAGVLEELRAYAARCAERDPAQVVRDHERLQRLLRGLDPGARHAAAS